MSRARGAFTLIEVMVAVVIISVVIMALFEMQGNSAHLFSKFITKLKTNQYSSFFIASQDYGFEKDSVNLDDLLSEFDVENELRKELKEIKVKITYEKLDSFSDASDEDANEDTQVSSNMILEIGKTTLNINEASSSLVRLRMQ